MFKENSLSTQSIDTHRLAHRYATFLCSWDVEIDNSLVGQLTTHRYKVCRHSNRNSNRFYIESKSSLQVYHVADLGLLIELQP